MPVAHMGDDGVYRRVLRAREPGRCCLQWLLADLAKNRATKVRLTEAGEAVDKFATHETPAWVAGHQVPIETRQIGAEAVCEKYCCPSATCVSKHEASAWPRLALIETRTLSEAMQTSHV